MTGEKALYLFDQPKNSLSPENQLKLKSFLKESVRFYGCQFVISTHSPFILQLFDADIYNLDKSPVVTEKRYELDAVKAYYDFFVNHKNEFG